MRYIEKTYLEIEEEVSNLRDWYKWNEEAGAQAVCLFCEFSSSLPDCLRDHMQELHDFDLHEIKLKLKLNFYQKVKLVNYIRRRVYQGICYGCQEEFQVKKELLDHMHSSDHISRLPALVVWDQPQYYFPTYENDNLLCQLEDCEDDNDDEEWRDNDDDVPVIAEDIPTSLRHEILHT